MAIVAMAESSLAAGAKEAAVVALQGSRDTPVPEAVLGVIERAIDDTDTLNVIGHETIARRLRRQFRDPPALESGVDGALQREAGELLEAVAYGRDDETVARGRAIVRRESLRLAATNRSEAASRALGNVCLFVVRALLHGSAEPAARAQVRECLWLVPDLDPTADAHPPDVRTAVAAVRSETLGRLVVVPVANTPPSCAAVLQGRKLGKLPLEVELVPGVYALQTDCGAPGLVRQVSVRAGKSERVTVAPRVERALRLARPSTVHRDVGTDALGSEEVTLVAQWLELSELWTVERAGQELRVTRWAQSTRGIVARDAIRELVQPSDTLERRIETAVSRIACKAAGCTSTGRDSRAATRTLGLIGAGVGVAAIAGSWASWARYAALDREIERRIAQPGFEESQINETLDEQATFDTLAIVSTSVGSGLFAASMPLALPERSGVPWWAWAAGVAGLGAAGVGTRLWIDHADSEVSPCPAGSPPGTCSDSKAEGPLAPMLVTQGAGLVAIPLTYLIRGWTGSQAGGVGVGALPSGVGIAWTQPTRAF